MKFQKIGYFASVAFLIAALVVPVHAATFPITQTFSGTQPSDWELRSNAVWNMTTVGDQTLQLTPATNGMSGLGFYNDSFSSSLGIVAQFRYYAGGGSGADGLTFFLVDGDQVDASNIAAGSSGAGLGYVQNTGGVVPGIPHAYIGIGFDEYGNFITANGTGLPSHPQSVVLRGSGNNLTGYNYLTHRDVLADFGQTIDGGWRTARVTVTPGSTSATIRVEMSWDEGVTWQTVINDYVYNQVPPTNLKLGFSASTGGSNNIHAIGNLEVILPVDLQTQVTVPPAGTYHRGDAFTYTYTITNASPNDSADTTITNTIPLGALGFQNVTWNLTSTSGGPASGTGADIGTIHRAIPSGATVTVVVSGTVGSQIYNTTDLSHTITAIPETTVKDPSTANAIAAISPTSDGPRAPGVLPLASAGTTPDPVIITLSDYTLEAGQAATVTFTFPLVPATFTTDDITAPNGTISNLAITGDPKIYTATYTAAAGTTDATNIISVNPRVSITQYAVGGGTDISFDGVNMWVTNGYGDVVRKITPTGVGTNYTGTSAQPFAIAFDGTNMWTGNNAGGSVSKVTPSGVITNYTSIANNILGIAFDGTNMWASSYTDNSVSKIAPNGSKTTYTGTGSAPWGVAFDGTNIWTANNLGNSVTKITSSGVMTTYSLGSGTAPITLAFDGTNMWSGNIGNQTVSKITSSGVVTTYPVGVSVYGLAFDGTNMWSANYGDSSVSKITPTGEVTTYSGVGANPRNIAFDGTSMWTVDLNGVGVSKVTPIGSGSSVNFTINPAAVVAQVSGGGVVSPSSNTTASSLGGIVPIIKTETIPSPVSTQITSSARDLKTGMSGDDVKALQQFLISQGYPISAGTTGYFGAQTKSALIKYQSKNTITPASGYFGAKTRTQMKVAQLAGLWW